MSAPVPAPRTLNPEVKKPVPKPRSSIAIIRQKSDESSSNSSKTSDESNTNTFSKRVRNASKQIAGDIADLVHERNRALREGTRESVRRITKRFTSNSSDTSADAKQDDEHEQEIADMFNNIQFQSPVQSVYSNSSDDSQSYPPPLYPPPPLREENIYDAPQSVASTSSTESSGHSPVTPKRGEVYESVFPSYPYNSDTESCVDLTGGTIDRRVVLSRSDSWSFYDQVPRPESLYNNVDSTPPIKPTVITETDDEMSDLVSNGGVLERANSLYGNCVPGDASPKWTRPTNSIILQFDPLNNNAANSYENVVVEDGKRMLEELLQGDLDVNMSNVDSYDNWSLSNESESDDYLNPPPPPARFDSLPESESAPPIPPKQRKEKSRSNWFTDANIVYADIQPPPSNAPPAATENNRKSRWLKQMNDVLKKAPDVVKGLRNKESVLPRPALGPKTAVQHKGMLYKVQSGPVEDLFGEFSGRWCVLENGCFVCYADNSCDSAKENFAMENVLSVQILLDQKYRYRYENDDLHCFELNTSGKSRGGHVYGSRSISERRVWMQRVAESLTHRFSAKITSDYTRIGWAYVREGVSGQWVGAWIVLSQRTLYYAVDGCSVRSLDLRKARYVVLQQPSEQESGPKTNDKSGPNMLVDCTNGALYLRMWTARETKVWCHIVKLAAHNNGANLDQQQLTKNDVPVIVEKSINFIYARGCTTEGIYRRAGSGTAVNELLARFRKDAWDVQLTSARYSEHDVATALKRFFRDLPEPLMTTNNRQYLQQVSLVESKEEKIRMYKAIFDQFPPVSYKTARRLFGHLHFIASQKARNRMPADNLAAVWGPTLMQYDEKDGQNNLGVQKSGIVVAQIINMYRYIFPEDPTEVERERKMLQVLERCLKSPQGAVNNKVTGDFRVWVYLFNKEGETFNVALNPQKTAYELCVELASKLKADVHEMILEECVLDGKLVRPIHHTEKVLDVVLRWGYWDEQDRKDNYLILSKLAKYWEYIQDKSLPVSAELKFADSQSKNFKSFVFEFSQAKLSYYKDKTCATKLGSWNIEDVVWYVGNEPRRNPPSKWTITFIEAKEHPKRTKQSPWFGNTLVWADPSLRATWLAAMLKSRYPKGIEPPPQHVNLMSN